MIHTAQKIATTDLPVLILGESGTGKELIAQAIHNASWRQNKPFIAINLASLPETLIESELFGYEEGAFTGAQKAGKPGLFELAIGGTLFLDEIGEISPHIQVKLLRVLEEKEIRRIGGAKIIPIDLRIIAATNQDINKMVKEGSFRRDLYFRICVSPLEIPPLRTRVDDIMELGEYFFSSYNKKNTKITPDTLNLMLAYDWPGNVRELKEIIRFCTQLGEDEHEGFELFNQTLYRLTERATLKSMEEVVESAWESLSAMGNVRDFLAMLQELIQAKKNGERIGRESLQRKLESKGIHLSQQQVRTRLESLQKLGCIKSSSGRRGSFITSEGERLLHYLES
ncbi:sigma 54-interacting transcriptional regulator [Desulfosporosinus sp. HMP52]|uniref:sigma-54 interaction domain-containing protein n=1 Tax=Desulfosporosinus sp. HMP52 TaxID=1487923 RepID=UPI00068F6371|nr:sigma 54-interacting transcriptional regulator [Desulfosporosinus sp. HMP52]